jgi:anti-sigma factor RsiW
MTAAAEMVCIELVELVTEYLEERLAPDQVRRFEAHLEGCPHCRVYLAQMRVVVRAVGFLPETAVTPEARAVLLEHFRTWNR